MKFRIPIFLLCLLIGATASAQHLSQKNYQKKIVKDMKFIKISDSIYYDKNEICNLDWMEYQFWLEKVYGKDSPEYRAALPDKEIIRQQMPLVESDVYLHSPAYVHLPVFGVNTEQARAYCRWRTDRVAEFILVNMKLLEWNPEQNPNNFFTLQNNNGLPADLRWLIFSLPAETMETSYGFRCCAQWR